MMNHVRETESTQPVLSVRGLEYRYTKAAVWSDVFFSLAAGELAALYGSNGSGKSTLFRCLAGWAQPTQGSIDVSGVPFNGASRSIRRSIAYVPDIAFVAAAPISARAIVGIALAFDLVKAAPLAALAGYLVGVAAQVALPGAAGPLVFSAYATFAVCAAVASFRVGRPSDAYGDDVFAGFGERSRLSASS